jgi:hypothetical protein
MALKVGYYLAVTDPEMPFYCLVESVGHDEEGREESVVPRY